MNSQPKVSIVIPVFNGADYLREAIDSALAQTYPNIEIVVVNDGSRDEGVTECIALSYGDKIRYFSKENGGVASALNLAIAKMSGEYFSWLSHDDLYTKDKVEKEINALFKMGRDDVVIYSDYAVFTCDPDDAKALRMKGVPPEHFRYSLMVDISVQGCTLLIPRSAFEKVGGFNERLRTTQDYDLWFRMAKEFSFIHMPEVLVKFRKHPNQGTCTMANIVLVECNDLYSNFIHGLAPQEIMSASTHTLAKSYAEIASHMFNRELNEAGTLAEKYARENSNQLATITRSMRYLGNRLLKNGIKLIPLKIKLVIMACIRFVMH